jgi:hypothetical protein
VTVDSRSGGHLISSLFFAAKLQFHVRSTLQVRHDVTCTRQYRFCVIENLVVFNLMSKPEGKPRLGCPYRFSHKHVSGQTKMWWRRSNEMAFSSNKDSVNRLRTNSFESMLVVDSVCCSLLLLYCVQNGGHLTKNLT